MCWYSHHISWYLRFSWWWLWRLPFSGMWHRAVLYTPGMFLRSADTCEHSKGTCLEAEKLSSTTLYGITLQNSLRITHPHMLSSFHIRCFSNNGCLLGFYALLVLTFQRCESSGDWIGPGGWWSEGVEKPTIFCNRTTLAATWTNSDILKMEAIFSSKTVKQSSPHGVKVTWWPPYMFLVQHM